MTTPEQKPDIIAALDQAQTGDENIAELVANYYKTLIHKGVDLELAGQLTRDYQQIFFTMLRPQ